MTSALKVSGGRRRSHSRRRGLLGDMKYVLSGSRSHHHSRRRVRGGVKGGAAPVAAEPVVGGAVAAPAAAPVPEIAGGAAVAESKAPEVAPVSGGRRRRSRSPRHRRYSRMRMGGGLFDDFQAPMMGGSRVFDAGFDGVLGGEIDGGRRYRSHRHQYTRRRR